MDPATMIREVKEKPELWEPLVSDAETMKLADNSWAKLGEKYNENANKLSLKWKTMFDCYCLELEKIKKKKTPSSWKYFPMMMFLKSTAAKAKRQRILNFRKRFSANCSLAEIFNLTDDSEVATSTTTLADDRETLEGIHQTSTSADVVINSKEINQSDCQMNETDDSTDCEIVKIVPVTDRVRYKLVKLEDGDYEEPDSVGTTQKRKRIEIEDHEEKHMMFLRSLIPYLNKIPEKKLLEVQMMMQRLIYQQLFPSNGDD